MTEKESKPFSLAGRVVGVNLLVFVALIGICFGINGMEYRGFLEAVIPLVSLQVLGCFIAFFGLLMVGKSDYARAFLLSGFVVGLIGFSACTSAFVYEANNHVR